MTTVICIPVLGRPTRVQGLVDNIEETTPEPHRILFICTPGDDEERDAVDTAGVERIDTPDIYERGDYAHKINLAYRASWEEFLFLGADDLLFHDQWLSRALDRMSDTVGVVGTNDLGNQRVIAGLHATHSLVARWYVARHGTIDEPRKVLHEGYWHEFVDDEFVKTAKYRKMWAFAGDSHVEHLHPNWGKRERDWLDMQEPARMKVGRRIYEQRCRLWT